MPVVEFLHVQVRHVEVSEHSLPCRFKLRPLVFRRSERDDNQRAATVIF
jgi:hypothetical protein